jgi:hypothetical protein
MLLEALRASELQRQGTCLEGEGYDTCNLSSAEYRLGTMFI